MTLAEIQSNVLLYADDLKLFTYINSTNFSMTSQKSNHDVKINSIIFSYKIDNDIVTSSTQFKDLGVIFNSKLTFTVDINRIIANAYRNLGFIRRTSRRFNDISTLSLLPNAFVHPKL